MTRPFLFQDFGNLGFGIQIDDVDVDGVFLLEAVDAVNGLVTVKRP
jgi:hypothetical protein